MPCDVYNTLRFETGRGNSYEFSQSLNFGSARMAWSANMQLRAKVAAVLEDIINECKEVVKRNARKKKLPEEEQIASEQMHDYYRNLASAVTAANKALEVKEQRYVMVAPN